MRLEAYVLADEAECGIFDWGYTAEDLLADEEGRNVLWAKPEPALSRVAHHSCCKMEVPGEPARQVRVAPDEGGRVQGVDQPTTGPGRG